MPLITYHYVDERRLDLFAEQIDRPIFHGKHLLWEMSLWIKFLKIQTADKPLSTDEKATKVLDYLKRDGSLQFGRIKSSRASSFDDREDAFRLETCDVIPARIPANKHAMVERPGLDHGMGMWISERDEDGKPNLLILLRNFEMDDEISMEAGSSYSVLVKLADLGFDLRAASEEAGVGVFGQIKRQLASIESEARHSKFRRRVTKSSVLRRSLEGRMEVVGTERRRDLRAKAIEHARILRKQFTSNPVGFLQSLGARIDARKRVEVLYKVRNVGHDAERRKLLVTIGYPIFIRSL